MKSCSDIFNRINWSYKILWLSCFIINISLIWIRKTPVITDEFNPLGYAYLASGYDLTKYFAADGYYYKYGQLLIYFLPVHYLNKSQLLFPCLLLINSIIVSFMPILVYEILAELSNGNRKREYYAYSLLIGVLPDLLLASKMIWAEPVLITITTLELLLVLKTYNSRKEISWLYSVLIAFVQVYAYALHSRGIVVIIATTTILLAMRFVMKKQNVNIWLFLGCTFIFICIDRLLSSYFKDALYSSAPLIGSAENSDMLGFVKCLFSKNGFKTWIQEIIGWIFASANGTFGLLIIGLFAAVKNIFNYFKSKEFDTIESLFVFWIFLYFLGSLLMGTLFFLEGIYDETFSEIIKRGDKLIYSRYISGAAILLSLYGIREWKEKDNINKAECLFTLAILAIVDMYAYVKIIPRIDNTVTYPHITFTINIFCDFANSDRGGIYSSVDNFGLSITLFAICVLVYLFIVYISDTKRVVSYIVLSTIIYFVNTRNSLYYMDHYMYERTELYSEILDCIDTNETITLYIDEEVLRMGFQYRFPDYRIASPRDVDSLGDSVVYIGIKRLKPEMNYPQYHVESDNMGELYVYGDNLASILTNNGYTISPFV